MPDPKDLQPPAEKELPTAQTLEQFAINQSKDFDNRAKEIELKGKEAEVAKIDAGHIHVETMKMYDLQSNDLKDQRSHQKFIIKSCISALVLFLAFLGGLIVYDKGDIAMEIIKAILFILTGAGGGYGYSKYSSDKSTGESDE